MSSSPKLVEGGMQICEFSHSKKVIKCHPGPAAYWRGHTKGQIETWGAG